MMATKTLPSILKANAADIVDQAASEVIEIMAIYPEQPAKKPFSNKLVRIVNSPDLTKKPLSDVERAAVNEMIEESKQIRHRAHCQSRKQQEMQRRFELEMLQIENQEHLEAEMKLKQILEKREAERTKRAENALMNTAKRTQLRQEENQRLRRAKDLVRRSSKVTVLSAPGQKEPKAKTKASDKDLTIDPSARERWKHFIRCYRKTKWFKMMSKELAKIDVEKRQAQEEKIAKLIRRHDYGLIVRHHHVPEQSVRLHNQLLARIEQLKHPFYIRQTRDVRVMHPVVAGKPGTEKPAEEEAASATKKYPNYLELSDAYVLV